MNYSDFVHFEFLFLFFLNHQILIVLWTLYYKVRHTKKFTLVLPRHLLTPPCIRFCALVQCIEPMQKGLQKVNYERRRKWFVGLYFLITLWTGAWEFSDEEKSFLIIKEPCQEIFWQTITQNLLLHLPYNKRFSLVFFASFILFHSSFSVLLINFVFDLFMYSTTKDT